jgi:phosphatidate cytidylyltransferase
MVSVTGRYLGALTKGIVGTRESYYRIRDISSANGFKALEGDASEQQGIEAANIEASPETKKSGSSLTKRAIFGSILGALAAVIIVIGGWPFAAVTCLLAYQCSQEFIGLVNAKGIAKGMKPPHPLVSSAISLMCVALSAWSFISGGKMASAMAVATLLVLSLELIVVKKPTFAQLTSSVFGLMYCGYLPSFWIKLRLLSIPAANSVLLHSWEGPWGITPATVGLVATFTAVLCIRAADTGAYFCGKSLGKTQLISVSPKKTVEGAIGGLVCSILGALGCYKMFQWPGSHLGAGALGAIVFISSIFGDLIESVIKRDAGLKDASNLIPGHGGLLDRLDSYLFTGACVYFYMRFFMVGFGV